jgi:chromatin remodeling complex protein RSC6
MEDEKLQAVFGGKNKVSMFEMNRHLVQYLNDAHGRVTEMQSLPDCGPVLLLASL